MSEEKTLNIVSQEDLISGKIYKTQPTTTVGSKIVYSDNLLDTNRIYTYMYDLDLGQGLKKYGLRCVCDKNGDYKTYYNFSDIDIVELDTIKVHKDIYAFDNPQTVMVNDKWRGQNLFPSNMLTNEYFIDGSKIIPKYAYSYPIDNKKKINKSFYDLTQNELNDSNIYISYSYTSSAEELTYSRLPITHSNLRRQFSTVVYEEKYNLVTDITTLTANTEIYKFNVKSLSYERVTYDQIIPEISNDVKLINIYVKSRDQKIYGVDEGGVEKPLMTGDNYVVNYSHNGDESTNYYNIKGGIIKDGSLQYYGSTYVLIDNKDLNEERINSYEFFIKIPYTPITSCELLKKCIENKVPIFNDKLKSSYTKKWIPNDVTIFDVNIDGSTMYMDTNDVVLSLSYVQEKINEAKKSHDSKIVLTKTSYYGFSNKVAKYQVIMEPTFSRLTAAERDGFLANNENDETKINESLQTAAFYIYEGNSFYKLSNKKLLDPKYTGEIYVKEVNALSSNEIDKHFASDKPIYCSTQHICGDLAEFSHTLFNGNVVYYNELNKTTYKFVNTPNVTFNYWTDEQEYIETKDTYPVNNIKPYFVKSKNENLVTSINCVVASEFVNYINDSSSENEKRKKIGNIRSIYKDNVTTNKYVTAYVFDSDVTNPYDFFNDPSRSSYVEYIVSKYLYDEFTVNGGVKQNNSGSYYVDVAVFNKNNGNISQSIKLNKYTYDLLSYQYVEYNEDYVVINDERDITGYNYEYYAVKDDNKVTYITDFTEQPAYFIRANSYGYELRKTVKESVVSIYNGTNDRSVGGKNAGKFQYSYSDTGTPIAFNIGTKILGLVSKYRPLSIGSDGIPREIEIVELYPHVVNVSYAKGSKPISLLNDKTEDISSEKPFTIKNDVTLVSTGTYEWHPPVKNHKIIYSNGEYSWQELEQSGAYWKENVNEIVHPFNVSSYVYYADDERKSSSYNFMPTAYVLKSSVEFPEIKYQSKIPYTTYSIYYTYEVYSYNEDSGVTTYSTGIYIEDDAKRKYIEYNEEENAYYAVVKVQKNTPSGTVGVNVKRRMYKHLNVNNGVRIGDYIEQQRHIENTYFTYNVPFELTNQKVPKQYVSELRPAVIKNVNVWDSTKKAYILTPVIESYAYYAYDYILETIPFEVNSNLVQKTPLNIAYVDEIKSYVGKLSTANSTYLNKLSKGINDSSTYIGKKITDGAKSTGVIIERSGNYIKTSISGLNKSIVKSQEITNSYLNGINTSISLMSSATTKQIERSGNYISSAVTKSVKNASTSITKQQSILSSYINNLSGNITASLRSTIIGTPKRPIGGTIDPKGNVKYSYQDVKANSLNELLDKLFVHNEEQREYNDQTKVTTISYNNLTIADILYRIARMRGDGTKNIGIPYREEFITECAKDLYTSIDYETEITDNVEYDDNGNITRKDTHKNNPYEMAKKSIMRAKILWNELIKEGVIIED